MAETAKKRARPKKKFFDDSYDDFSCSTPPLQETKPTKLKKKTKKKAATVYTSTQADVSPGRAENQRTKRTSPDERRFQKELEDALRLSADETVSSVEIAPVMPRLHNMSSADTVDVLDLLSSEDENEGDKQKMNPNLGPSGEQTKPLSMGISEKEMVVNSIKEKDLAPSPQDKEMFEEADVIILGSDNSRPNSQNGNKPNIDHQSTIVKDFESDAKIKPQNTFDSLVQDAKIDPLEAFDPLVSSEPDAKIDPLGVFDPLVSNMVTKLKRKKKAEGWITKPKITSVKDKIAAMDQFIENLPADGDKISNVQCLPETLLKTVPENVPEIPVKNGFLVDNDSPVKQRPKRRGIIESDDEQESPLTEKLPRRLNGPLADKRPRRLNVLDSEDEESKAFEEKAEQVKDKPEKRKRKIKRIDSDSDSDFGDQIKSSRLRMNDENSIEEDYNPEDSDDDYAPKSSKSSIKKTAKKPKKSPASRPLSSRNANLPQSKTESHMLSNLPQSKPEVRELSKPAVDKPAVPSAGPKVSKPEAMNLFKPVVNIPSKPEARRTIDAAKPSNVSLTPIQSKTKSLVGNSATKVRIPAWTPPARIIGTKLPTRGTNSSLSSPATTNFSPSIGLRVGLSRNSRVKPLHSSVKNVD